MIPDLSVARSFMQQIRIGAVHLALLFTAVEAAAQDSEHARITGRVTNAVTGQAVTAADVRVVGTTSVARTDADGRYSIPNAHVGVYAIEARRAGLGNTIVENVRLRAGSESVVNFIISSRPLRLTETVNSASLFPVAGNAAPYTVDKVTAEYMPVPGGTSPLLALAGKVAGLSVLRSSGAPGADVLVQLRTAVSLFDNTTPLFVVDGVMLNSQFLMTSQDIASLDIASIEVIKGASAASMYGGRGASGVISITTNRGNSLALGKTQFTVRNEAGGEFTTGLPDGVQSHQYRVDGAGHYVNQNGSVVGRSGRIPQTNGILENRYIDPLYNHNDQFFRRGLFNTQTISLQQNRAATNFNVVYSRNEQPGTVPDAEGYQRQTARVNADYRLKDRARVGVSASRAWAVEEPEHVDFTDMLSIDPDIDLRAPGSSSASKYVIIPDAFEGQVNPLYLQLFDGERIHRNRSLVGVNASVRVLSWLSLDGSGSYDSGDWKRSYFVAPGAPNPTRPGTFPGRNTATYDSATFTLLQGGVTVSKAFGKLSGKLAVRAESQNEKSAFHAEATIPFDTIGGAQPVLLLPTIATHFKGKAAVANVGLNYGGKYVADLLVRREENSPRDLPKIWRTFSRGSAAWLLNEESWLPFTAFNLFKLHYSIGLSDITPGGDLKFIPNGARFTSPQPDSTTEQELGLDVIFRHRIQGSVAYAKAKTRIVNGFTGPFGAFPTIAGAIRLLGTTTEGTVQAHLLNNPAALQWDILFTGSHHKNSLTQFTRTCYTDGLQRLCEGTTLGAMTGHRLLRDKSKLQSIHANSSAAFDINDEGYVVPVGNGNTWRDGKAKNLWGTIVRLDGRDYQWGLPIIERDNDGLPWEGPIGDANPDLQYGFQNTFRYNGFRMYVQFTGQLGGDVYNETKQLQYNIAAHTDIDQFGRPDELRKPVAYYRAQANSNSDYQQAFVESATHARLAEASIGYEFSANKFAFMKRIGAETIQIDLVGRNLFTLSKYSGQNPEGNALTPRIDQIGYPLSRTFTLATGITF